MNYLIKTVGLLLGVFFVLGISCPAQAGWNLSYEATGSVYQSHSIPTLRPWGMFNPVGADSTNSDNPSALTSTRGTITLVCKWTPSNASDKLQDVFYIAVSSQADAYANYGLAPGPTFSARVVLDNGFIPLEQPTYTSATYGTTAKSETWQLKGVQYLLKTATSGTKGADGSLTWRIPLKVNSQVWGEGSSGAVHVSVGAGASVELPIFSPNPRNLAFNDGSTAPKTLNQYVITNGIPTSITTQNATLSETLRTKSSWALVGTTPRLLPQEANTTTPSPGSFLIRPSQKQDYVPLTGPLSTPPPPVSGFTGLLFSLITQPSPSNTSNVGWGFPVNNNSFGQKTFNHIVDGKIFPANVALFYPSMEFQHPTGEPKMVDGSLAGVPNHVYYYDKSWKNPWGIEVRFRNVNYSAYGLNGDSYSESERSCVGLSGKDLVFVSAPQPQPVLRPCEGETTHDATHFGLAIYKNRNRLSWSFG